MATAKDVKLTKEGEKLIQDIIGNARDAIQTIVDETPKNYIFSPEFVRSICIHRVCQGLTAYSAYE